MLAERRLVHASSTIIITDLERRHPGDEQRCHLGGPVTVTGDLPLQLPAVAFENQQDRARGVVVTTSTLSTTKYAASSLATGRFCCRSFRQKKMNKAEWARPYVPSAGR